MRTTINEYFSRVLPHWWEMAGQSVLRVVVILLLALVAFRLANKLSTLLSRYLAHRAIDAEGVKRVTTLERVLRYLSTVIITLLAGTLILDAIGISVAPILATAGVVGLAVGFGAQSLVKDFFTGFFLLLEDQIRQGDLIEAGGKAGIVEEITLRYMRLRDFEGNVHFVPNGTVSTVTNRSREYSYALIDIGVARNSDLNVAYRAIQDAAEALQRDQEMAPKLLANLEIAGIEAWKDNALLIRSRFKVLPREQWAVRRAFLEQLHGTAESNALEVMTTAPYSVP